MYRKAGIEMSAILYNNLARFPTATGCLFRYLQIAEALGVTLNDLFYDTADCLSSRLLSSYEDQLSMLTEYERNVVTQVTESTIDIMLQLRKIAK